MLHSSRVPAAQALTPRRDEEESVDDRLASESVDLEDRSSTIQSASSGSLLQLQTDETEQRVARYRSRQWTWQHVQQPRWWAHMIWRQKGTIIALLVLFVILLLLGLLVDGWHAFSWQAWWSISVTLVTFILLVRNDMDPALTMMLSMTLLLAPNVLEPAEALKGFSSSGIFTIGILFVCARGVSDSGILELLLRKFFPRDLSLLLSMCALFIPISLLSGFIANTPLVAMCIPLIENFARTRNIAPSKLLIPLSYSAILGGTLTMIGTSTNLVVQGLAQDRDPSLEFPFFLVGLVGAPILVLGLAYVFLVGQLDWMLPVRKSAVSETLTNASAHLISMQVREGSPAIGKSIEEARLRHLHGVYLVEIEREGECLSAPGPEFVLREGDTLLFTGDVRDVGDLLRVGGLTPTHEEQMIMTNYTRILVEAVLSTSSQLVGHTLNEANFRTQFDAGVISIFRSGQDMKGKIGTIPLEAGDALLMVCKPSFIKFRSHTSDFLVVRQIGDAPISFPIFQLVMAPLLQMTLIVLSAIPTDYLDTNLLNIALCTMFAMYFTKCVTWESMRSAVNIPIMVTIMASFPMSTALEKYGVARELSDNLVFLTSWMGEFGIYLGVYISTMILTALLSNASSAAIMVPIAFSIAEAGDVEHGVRPLLYTIMVAASADFSTPIGYQTNLMVWNQGGYKFLDYTRFGFPLQIVLAVISCVVIFFAGDILGSPSLVSEPASNLCDATTASCKMCSYTFSLIFDNWTFSDWPLYPGNNVTNTSLVSNASFCETFVPPYSFTC